MFWILTYLLQAPYYIPKIAVPTITSTLDMLAITPLAQNDVVVDIVVVEQSDSILVSVEVVDGMMTEDQARDIIGEWVSIVKSIMSVA